jgi:cytochrome c oxidase cbb3-type subunit 3
MISKKHLLLVGWIVLLLTGCGEDAKEAPRVVPPTTPQTARVPSAPPSSAPETHPVTQKTRDTYQWYCTQCHGIAGKGNGINAKLLTVPPRDHTKADYLETRTDQQLFDAIQQGGLAVGRAPCMPSWGNTLSEDTIHSLVRYIRELCKCEAI